MSTSQRNPNLLKVIPMSKITPVREQPDDFKSLNKAPEDNAVSSPAKKSSIRLPRKDSETTKSRKFRLITNKEVNSPSPVK